MTDTTNEKKVGKYVLASKKDFDDFRDSCLEKEGWKNHVDKPDIKVWTKSVPTNPIDIVKLWAKMKNIKAATLYDVLHDPEYRKTWDENMIEGVLIEQLDPYNDVGYYAAKSPIFVVANRDFCNQRSWYTHTNEKEFIIINHSVPHDKCPKKKDFVRANSIRTGYVVTVDPEDSNSCILTYQTQSDPEGMIPTWVVNKVASSFAPKLIERMVAIVPNYEEWKKKNNPTKKPWLPESRPWFEQ